MAILIGRNKQPQLNQTQLDGTFNPDVSKYVGKLIPPRAYQGLKTGPEINLTYEDVLANPIDGSAKDLKAYSPFVLQVEPPLVYQQSTQPNSRKSHFVNTYANAKNTVNGFANARSSLSKTRFAGGSITTDSIESDASIRNASTQKGMSGDGSFKQTAEGNSSVRLGRPSIADLSVALDIALQLKAVLNTPPLILLINPTSFSVQYSRIHQFQDRTRYGYIYHTWGEEQPKLSISARCGAFISGGRGASWASKRDSAAWQNLMNAFHFYRNNGYIYDTVGQSNAHHLIGALSIHYDQFIYYGHMDSMSWSYEEGQQYGGITFEMAFTCSLMVDTAQPSFAVNQLRSPQASGGRIQSFSTTIGV